MESPWPNRTTESIKSGRRPWKSGRLRWPNVMKRYDGRAQASTVDDAACGREPVFGSRTRLPRHGASLVL
ncbi:hypothetical protein E2C01_026896 [Portunus trituberculatus]|uniref:Uncharacterized protein n=1 Tax=Portunus trituberculatus TaxID=210409 RepID=A0A5B7EGQ3_PORTR|nr:hypothetical protein [Portunus trituberculatus]